MGFTNVMFFSGSVLHEEDLPVLDVIEHDEYSETSNRLRAQFAHIADEEARELALSLATNEAMRNGRSMEYLTSLNRALREYCYRDYLKCVHQQLPEFLSKPCAYLMYEGQNVLSQGRTPFHFYAPGAISIQPSDGKETIALKLKQGRRIGAFARTASIAERGKFEFLGCTAEARFIQKSETADYNVIKVPAEIPQGWRAVQVDGKATVANSSSRVLKADMDAFVEKMLRSNIGFPVFSVSDCNSFHTSGYLWATYAIRSVIKTDDNAPVVILNFDQHKDIGSTAPSALIASDGWGGPSLSFVKNGLYMSFGNATNGKPGLNQDHKWPNVLIVRKNGVSSELTLSAAKNKTVGDKSYTEMNAEEKLWYVGGVIASLKGRWSSIPSQPKDASLDNLAHGAGVMGMRQAAGFPYQLDALNLGAIFAEFWKNLSTYLGRPIQYVFITVDRDAIQNHQTQWGDSSFFPNASSLHYTMSTLTDALFTECPDSKLIGLDITGLPESRVAYRHRTDKLVAVAPAWAEVEDELRLLHAWGNSHVQRMWSNIPASFTDTAMIIFSHLERDLRGKTLKPYLTPDTLEQIRVFLSRFHGVYKAGLLMKATRLEAEVRESMDRIKSGLRDASSTKQYIPKEVKTTLQAYANRIDSLLNPPEQVARMRR